MSLLDVPALLSPLAPDRAAMRQSFATYPWASQPMYTAAKSKVLYFPEYKLNAHLKFEFIPFRNATAMP